MRFTSSRAGNNSNPKSAGSFPIPAISAVIAVSALLALVPGCGTSRPPVEGKSDAEKEAAINSMYEEYRADFPDAAEIDVEELLSLQESQDVLIVDVRTPEERAVSKIPGAITMESFDAMKKDLIDDVVVVHCTIGYRSGKYVEKLKAEGIKAYNLKGSILSWVHADQPVVDAEGNETKRVHVYGERWNLLPDGYEAVW